MSEIELDAAVELLEKGDIRRIEGDYRTYQEGVGHTDYGVTGYRIGDNVIRIDLKRK